MRTIKTVTIEEAMDLIRSYGVPVSYKKLTAWMDANVVPWAVSAPDGTGTYQRTIFRSPLVEWLNGLAEEV